LKLDSRVYEWDFEGYYTKTKKIDKWKRKNPMPFYRICQLSRWWQWKMNLKGTLVKHFFLN
jgi:hypothetical protein